MGGSASNLQGRVSFAGTSWDGGKTWMTASAFNYDAVGRVVDRWQCLLNQCSSGVPNDIQNAYDYLGHVIQAGDGASGEPHTVNYTYDMAGNLESATRNEDGRMLFGAPVYGPVGLQSATFGNGSGETLNYDLQGRVSSAAFGNSIWSAPVPAAGSVTIAGALQSYVQTQDATSSIGSATIEGGETQFCAVQSDGQTGPCKIYKWDHGTVTISVNGYAETEGYSANTTQASLAAALAADFQNDPSSPVNAVSAEAGGSATIAFTARSLGSVTYPVTVTSVSAYSDIGIPASFSGQGTAVTGGQNAVTQTIYDNGSTSITVNDHTYSYSWAGTCTNAESIAYALTNAINADTKSPVGAGVAGNVISLWALTPGVAGNQYLLTASANSSQNSFTAAVSGSTLSGGSDSTLSIASPAYKYSLQFAPDGNITALNDSVLGAWTYGYDKMNRLVTASSTSGFCNAVSLRWTYDRFGNRWSQDSAGSSSQCSDVETSLSFVGTDGNASNNQPSGWQYDAAGNLLTDGAHQYQYDAENRLVAVVDQSIQYFYDAAGYRVAKARVNADKSTTLSNAYLRGGHGEQIAEFDGSGKWIHTNVYANGLLGTYDEKGLHLHYSDWEGTRRVETVNDGVPQEAYFNLPFGDAYTVQQLTAGTIDDATEEHFTGQEHDNESGLEFFRKRYYLAYTGRFLSADRGAITSRQFANPQEWNRYVYVHNNPLGYLDSTGLTDYYVFRPLANQYPAGGDWAGAALTRESQGDNVTFYNGSEATTGNLNAARNNDGAVVVVVTDVVQDTNGNVYGIQMADGISGSMSMQQGGDAITGGSITVQVTAEDPNSGQLAVFGCDSWGARDLFSTVSYVGVYSPSGDGFNGEITVQGGDAAGAAYLEAGEGQAGAAAAQTALQNTPSGSICDYCNELSSVFTDTPSSDDSGGGGDEDNGGIKPSDK
jgi:RHS repeat-associated protein